jgi:hypothetical protein
LREYRNSDAYFLYDPTAQVNEPTELRSRREATRGIAAAATGAAMPLLDLHETAVFLLQLRGLSMLIKLGLVGALPLFGPWQGWILAALVGLSVVSSHASSGFRRFIVLGKGRCEDAVTKG